jgi:hypothetical protein
VRDSRQIVFHPGDLFVAERRHRANLEVEHVVQADEMHAALIETVPGPTMAIVIEKLEIAGHAFVDRVVLARNRVHAIDMNFLQDLARLPEFLGLRQVADIAGVHHEGRRLRQRIDVRDRAAQAADDVGIGFLAKADVCIADLHESERIGRGCCRGACGRRAECARHATGNRPDGGGAGPGGKTAQCLAAGRIVATLGRVVRAHVRLLIVKAGLPVPVCIGQSAGLFPPRGDHKAHSGEDSASERETQADRRIDGGSAKEPAGETVPFT